MKTYEIKDLLKKEILIVEFPEGYELAGVTNGAIYYYDNQMNYEDYPLSILVEGSYTLLGSPDEIKEKDVIFLVETDEISDVGDYRHQLIFIDYQEEEKAFETALESFNSALESDIFWDVNPLGEKPQFKYDFPPDGPSESMYESAVDDFDTSSIAWHEAQEKTFDKKRTLIFVKN